MVALKYKKIKLLDQYNEYCAIHEELFTSDEIEFQDDIELLEILLEDYDRRILQTTFAELNPVELLRSLLENNHLKQSDLAKKLGVSKQLISDVLNYRRRISKELGQQLSAFFAMTEEAFGRGYELKVEVGG